MISAQRLIAASLVIASHDGVAEPTKHDVVTDIALGIDLSECFRPLHAIGIT